MCGLVLYPAVWFYGSHRTVRILKLDVQKSADSYISKQIYEIDEFQNIMEYSDQLVKSVIIPIETILYRLITTQWNNSTARL